MKIITGVLVFLSLVVIAGCNDKQSTESAAPAATAPASTTSAPDTASSATTVQTSEKPEAKTDKKSEAKTDEKKDEKSAKEITTASGLKYKDIKVGKGTAVKKGDAVTANYKGWLDDGTVFDSSMEPGRDPIEFVVGVGKVIKGWDEGLVGMKVGGKRELTIPAELGYGEQGVGPIPPNSTLHFIVELVKISK